jgi:hypothetical protein
MLVDAPSTFLVGGCPTQWAICSLAADFESRYSNLQLKGFGAYGIVWYVNLGFDQRRANIIMKSPES